jgi:hypothetical protein
MIIHSNNQTQTSSHSTQQLEQVTVKLTMPLEKARQVRWSGRGRRASMGEMFDAHEINSGDLAWAIDKNDIQKVREAARTLLATWLGKAETIETTLRFGPKVYSGGDYLEEKQYDSLMNALVYAFAGAMFGLALLYWIVLSTLDLLLKGHPWTLVAAAGLLAFMLIMAILSPVLWWMRRRFQEEIANMRNYRAGREAESTVEELMREKLDSRWTIFRNLVLPGRKEDIDFVLVGPPGVRVVETKAYKGSIRVNNGTWERQEKKNWRSIQADPANQAKHNAARISDYLRGSAITLWVQPTIALTERHPVTDFQTSTVPIWFQYDLASQLEQLNRMSDTLLGDQQVKIVEMLASEINKQPKS